jgi:CDP-glycerol glycerophosphotransferase (TagB/SpsB family)
MIPRPLRLVVKLVTRLGERAFAAVLALVSVVVPRSERIWAFGSWYGQRFADNPKYFFLHCASRERQAVHAVWLSMSSTVVRRIRALGFPAYHRLSPRGLWYALRAGVYIFDCRVMDVSSVASRGALKVNLWHGVPLKMIERDIAQSDNAVAQANHGSPLVRAANKVLRPQLSERYDYILGTSRATCERFAGAFGVATSQVINGGYPRTDVLLSRDDGARFRMPEEERVIEQCRAYAREGTRVMLYMPTFRDWRNDADRVIPIDWPELDRVLQAHGGALFCKLHPNDQARLPDLAGLSRVHLIPSSVDPYPILRHTDALISDYSSIFFDYLLLDRPLVFYPYDLDDYRTYSRALYDDYDTVTPGPKAYDVAGLHRVLASMLSSYDEHARQHAAERATVRSRFYEHVDDRASARLFDALRERTAA